MQAATSVQVKSHALTAILEKHQNCAYCSIPSPGCALPRRLLAYCMTDPQRPVYHAAIIRTYHILVAKSEHRLSTSTKEGDLLLCLTQSRRILIPTFFQSEEVARLELTMDHPWEPMSMKQTSRPRRRHLHRREKTTLTNTTTPCVTAICCLLCMPKRRQGRHAYLTYIFTDRGDTHPRLSQESSSELTRCFNVRFLHQQRQLLSTLNRKSASDLTSITCSAER